MPESAATTTALGSGHSIFYLAGEDLRTDRHNIALLARLAERATTDVVVQIFYTGPRKPVMPTSNNLRLLRLNSASDFTLAAHILKAKTECVLFFDSRILAHAYDLWQLLGFSERHAISYLYPQGIVRTEHESFWHFALRAARFDLWQFVGAPPDIKPAIIALNLPLVQKQIGRDGRSKQGLLAQKYGADILRGYHVHAPLLRNGKSRNATKSSPPWLALLRCTVTASKIWHRERLFPYWFSYKNPLFLVAQIAFYLALLVTPLTVRGALLLAGFAVALSLPFYLRGFYTCIRSIARNRRTLATALMRIAARTLLYLIA